MLPSIKFFFFFLILKISFVDLHLYFVWDDFALTTGTVGSHSSVLLQLI